ncbi:MAG: hypothetical protein RRY29_09305 [Desulfovibrionaceae bacterium]
MSILPDHPAPFLPYQSRWAADKAQVKVCEKSRRIGLTWAQACDDVLTAATAGREGMDVLYISFNQDMTREYIDTCAEWAKKFSVVAGQVDEFVFKDGDEREIKAFRIDFASGYKILALSSRPSNLRGKQGRVVIDEAAFVEDLPELMKAALALLMWGGQVIIISTHNGAENAFNELVNDILAGRLPYSHHRITLDDALEDGLYRRICKVTHKEWTQEAQEAWRDDLLRTYGDGADEELFCIPRRSGGAWITGERVESCMDDAAKVVRWLPPVADFVDLPLHVSARMVQDWLGNAVEEILSELGNSPCWLGVDFGRSGDLSVFWLITELENTTAHTPLVLELRDAPFRTQEQILHFLVKGLPRFSGISLDARGNGQALAEYARQTFGSSRVNEVMLSEGWYREHMPRVKAALEDRTLTLPRDAEIKADLRALRVIRGIPRVPESRIKGGTGNRHCDSAVALAMALHARATSAGCEYAYEPALSAPSCMQAPIDDDKPQGPCRFGRGAW